MLLSPSYGRQYDVWAAGAVLAELLTCMKESVPSYKKRQHLFQSKYCFPMSPKQGMVANEDGTPKLPENDQLMQVFKVSGTPTDSDLSFI